MRQEILDMQQADRFARGIENEQLIYFTILNNSTRLLGQLIGTNRKRRP
jgi:hypothetical protein